MIVLSSKYGNKKYQGLTMTDEMLKSHNLDIRGILADAVFLIVFIILI